MCGRGGGLTGSVYPLADLHVFLLMLDSSHGHSQLVDHLLQFVLMDWEESTCRTQPVSEHVGAIHTLLAHVKLLVVSSFLFHQSYSSISE